MMCELLQPDLVVMQEPFLGIVYEHCRSYMHGIHEAQALLDAALPHEALHGSGDIYETATMRHLEP